MSKMTNTWLKAELRAHKGELEALRQQNKALVEALGKLLRRYKGMFTYGEWEIIAKDKEVVTALAALKEAS